MKTILRATILIALSACLAHADGVQPIVNPAGVLYGSKQHTIVSSSTVVFVDTTSIQLNALKTFRTNKVIFLDGTSMTSTSPFATAGVAWGAITGTLSNQTDLNTALNGIKNNFPVSLSTNVVGNLPASSIGAGLLGTSVIASSHAVLSVGIPQLNISGTPTSSNFLRGDGAWISSGTFGSGAGGFTVYPASGPAAFPFGFSVSTITATGRGTFGNGLVSNVLAGDIGTPGNAVALLMTNSNTGNVINQSVSLDMSTRGDAVLTGRIVNYLNPEGLGDEMIFSVSPFVSGGSLVEALRLATNSAGSNAMVGINGHGSAPGATLDVNGNANFAGVAQSTFTHGVTVGSLIDQGLTASQFVTTDASKQLASFNLLGGTTTWSGAQTFGSTGNTNFTYGVSVGSMQIRNVTSTLLAVDAFGNVASTTVAAAQTYVSSGVVFGNLTNNGINQDQTNFKWDNTAKILSVSTESVTNSTITARLVSVGTTILNGNNKTFIDQAGSGAASSILNFSQNGVIGGQITQNFFASVGPPASTYTMTLRGGNAGASLSLDGNGGSGINGLQNGTTFYVKGNVVIGSGGSVSATSQAPDNGLYIQGAMIAASSSTWRGNVNISSGLIMGTDAGTAGFALVSGGPNTVPTWSALVGSGIVSPGTGTWSNNHGLSLSTISVSGTATISSNTVIVSSGSLPTLSVTANSFNFGTNNATSGGVLMSCPQGTSQGFCSQIYSHQGAQAALSGALNIIMDNAAYNSVGLYMSMAGDNPQNGARFDGFNYSCVELIDSRINGNGSLHNGKFQICTHNDQLRGERRNAAGTAFESGWTIADSTISTGGVMYVGTDYDNAASTLAVNGNLIVGSGYAGASSGGSAPVNGALIQGQAVFVQHVDMGPTSASISSCGSGATIIGSDGTGNVTMGSGVSQCTISFHDNWTHIPFCVVQTTSTVVTAAADWNNTTISAFRFNSSAAVTGLNVTYHCFGRD